MKNNRQIKRMVCAGLSAVMLMSISGTGLPAFAAQPADSQSNSDSIIPEGVITEDLAAMLMECNADELIPVDIWIACNFNQDALEAMVKEKIGYHKEDIRTNPQNYTEEQVDLYTETERKLTVEMQAAQTKAFIEACKDIENLQAAYKNNQMFISSYAPMIRVRLIKAEILKIAAMDKTDAIYYCPNTRISDEDDIPELPQTGDVNLDGTVDLTDALLLLQEYTAFFAGKGCSFNAEQRRAANITGTKTTDSKTSQTMPFSVTDAQMLLQYYTCKNVAKLFPENVPVTDFRKHCDSYLSGKRKSIAYTQVAADYNRHSDSAYSESKSCIIQNAEQLRQNAVQPFKAYSGDFFKDHALIFVHQAFGALSGDGNLPQVYQLSIEENTVNVHAYRQTGFWDMMDYWCAFFEISKADLESLSEKAEVACEITEYDILPASLQKKAFTAVETDFNPDDNEQGMLYRRCKNCVILNAEQLKSHTVQPVKAYDDAFFEDHALIFVGSAVSGGDQITVTGISYEPDQITVSADYDDCGHDGLSWWGTFLEVSKAALSASGDNAEVICKFTIYD